jgi:hypothetical protein
MSDNDGLNLFGLTITKNKKPENKSASISVGIDDEGGALASSTGAAYYGIYMDVDGVAKNELLAIQKYREISLYPEVDTALQDIINEAVPQEDETNQLELNLDDLDLSDSLKDKIKDEFKYVLKVLKYKEYSADIFRRWYIDGRLFYQIIVDKDNLKRGIVDLIPLDGAKTRKIREIVKEKTQAGVDAIKEIKEYFVYNESGFGQQNSNVLSSASIQTQGIKLSPDSVIYVPSGYMDGNNQQVLSYLNKAIRSANQLRMLEDATVIYMIARAPERRIFYVDVGNLPKMKAEQYLKDIMNRYRNKMVYDAQTGVVKDDKKYMSMLEDFWMPRRDGGKGTEITTLPGATNMQGMLENVEYFKKKLYESLNIPFSRTQSETGFSMGRTTEVTRDEVKFQKFIEKLRRKFSQLILDSLKTHLILKGIVNSVEWDEIVYDIELVFQRDNFFSELKEQDIFNSRMMLLQQTNQFVGNYFSKEYIWKTVLRMTNEDIEEMKDQINNEKDDPTAQAWSQQQMMQPPMMGGDPNAGGGDPYSQDQQSQYPFQ